MLMRLDLVLTTEAAAGRMAATGVVVGLVGGDREDIKLLLYFFLPNFN